MPLKAGWQVRCALNGRAIGDAASGKEAGGLPLLLGLAYDGCDWKGAVALKGCMADGQERGRSRWKAGCVAER